MRMATLIKEIKKMEKKKDLENIDGRMETSIVVIGKMI